MFVTLSCNNGFSGIVFCNRNSFPFLASVFLTRSKFSSLVMTYWMSQFFKYYRLIKVENGEGMPLLIIPDTCK